MLVSEAFFYFSDLTLVKRNLSFIYLFIYLLVYLFVYLSNLDMENEDSRYIKRSLTAFDLGNTFILITRHCRIRVLG